MLLAKKASSDPQSAHELFLILYNFQKAHTIPSIPPSLNYHFIKLTKAHSLSVTAC